MELFKINDKVLYKIINFPIYLFFRVISFINDYRFNTNLTY